MGSGGIIAVVGLAFSMVAIRLMMVVENTQVVFVDVIGQQLPRKSSRIIVLISAKKVLCVKGRHRVIWKNQFADISRARDVHRKDRARRGIDYDEHLRSVEQDNQQSRDEHQACSKESEKEGASLLSPIKAAIAEIILALSSLYPAERSRVGNHYAIVSVLLARLAGKIVKYKARVLF